VGVGGRGTQLDGGGGKGVRGGGGGGYGVFFAKEGGVKGEKLGTGWCCWRGNFWFLVGGWMTFF